MNAIIINIDPDIYHLGFFTLRWYSLIVIISAVVGLWWAWRAAQKEGISQDTVTTLALWAIPGGMVGSRLVHVIDQLDYYLANPGAIIGGEGQAIYGAILGGALGAWIGSRVHRLPYARLLDLTAPGLLLAMAIGRVADIINGSTPGSLTDIPWALVYTHPRSYAPLVVPTHPAVVYEIIWDMVVFATVLKLRGRLAPAGSLFMLYLAMYSVGRFFVTFTRDNDPFLFGLYQAHVIALLVLMVMVPLLVARTHWVKKTTPAEEA